MPALPLRTSHPSCWARSLAWRHTVLAELHDCTRDLKVQEQSALLSLTQRVATSRASSRLPAFSFNLTPVDCPTQGVTAILPALCRYAGPGVEHWVEYDVGADAHQEPHLHRTPPAVEPGADQNHAIECLPGVLRHMKCAACQSHGVCAQRCFDAGRSMMPQA